MAFWRPGQRDTGVGGESDFVKGIEVNFGFVRARGLCNIYIWRGE